MPSAGREVQDVVEVEVEDKGASSVEGSWVLAMEEEMAAAAAAAAAAVAATRRVAAVVAVLAVGNAEEAMAVVTIASATTR